MSEANTTAEHRDRTSRAVRAATSAAQDLGLTPSDPRVLHDVFSVIVHLAPAPVVVRVPTVLPPSTADLAVPGMQQRTELEVAGWLADRGHPVVGPSSLVPREPVSRDGFSMTFWEHVEQDHGHELDQGRSCAMTAQLHSALREYPGELPWLAPLVEPGGAEVLPRSLTALESRPDLIDRADLDRAWREWAVLEPIVGSREGFRAAFPGLDVQLIHGDAPTYNTISTSAGPLCSDFELTCLGPVEWDLALVGAEGEAAYGAAAHRAGLRDLHEPALRLMESAGMLQAVACLELVPQLPLLAEGLQPLLEKWRATPPAEPPGAGRNR